ncbi:hypothetical protein [Shewanella sp. KCT]|uniref:hypothetical protein n=1 Tax=Shewanella sp. KCT TaxID=2569535 RepID=UPI001642CF12|nr:hypothetical protein [Shewanella sp. KCT]
MMKISYWLSCHLYGMFLAYFMLLSLDNFALSSFAFFFILLMVLAYRVPWKPEVKHG